MRWNKRAVVEIRRGGVMSDEEVRRALQNRIEGMEIRAVLELLGRLEDSMLLDAMTRATPQEKAEGLAAIEGVREAARQIAEWAKPARDE